MSRSLLAASALLVGALPAVAGEGCVGQCFQKAWLPPVYSAQAERVLVQAPRTYAYVTPATYRTVYETVMVSPGSRRWTVTHDAWGREIGCWVESPARYASVPRQVMVNAPAVVPVAMPAQYGLRMSTVMTQPARSAWVPVGHGYHGY